MLRKLLTSWGIASLGLAAAFLLCEAFLLIVLHFMSTDFDVSEALSISYVVHELIRVCPYAVSSGLFVTMGAYISMKREERL